MRSQVNKIIFEVKYEGHQSCSKHMLWGFWGFWESSYDIKFDLINLEPHHVKFLL